LNNTPIVVLFIPTIKKWAERLNISPSKFLIPLSYAAIFGGICTLIGTSTNLVVHGLMLENRMQGLTMFELAKIGVPCAIVGWVYIAFLGNRFLPDRKDILEVIHENRKEYVITMSVQKECSLIGKTIQDAGLRNLKGLFLIGIERKGVPLGPVSSRTQIEVGDHLIFVGVTASVVDLYDINGLVPVSEEIAEEDFQSLRGHFVEAVVSSSSPFIDKTIKESNFRARYTAGVIAVHRNGQKILSKIGSIRLRPGDTLLLLTGPDFVNNWKNSQDFYLVSTIKRVKPKRHKKAILSLFIVGIMILAAPLGKYIPHIGGRSITMLHAAIGAALLLVITRCIHVSEARKAIQWNVLIAIACAFGISKALQNSGAAAAIATSVINLVKGFGVIGVLAAIYFITTLFTEIITNNAAAALVFPIALSAANQLGVDSRPFFIAIAIAASASFMTPIGYQTNLIVQGAGGYKYRDYFLIGLPLNIIFFILAVIIIPLFWQF
jgi:di/tricarboxylate transporter